MNIFQQIAAQIAHQMTDDDLAGILQHAIEQYRETTDFGHIEAAVSMVVMRKHTQQVGSPEKAFEKFEQFKQFKNAFDHTQNKS